MHHYIDIHEVAKRLDTKPENARAVVNWFGVKSHDKPASEGQFGKPAKLYNPDDVDKIVGFKATEFGNK